MSYRPALPLLLFINKMYFYIIFYNMLQAGRQAMNPRLRRAARTLAGAAFMLLSGAAAAQGCCSQHGGVSRCDADSGMLQCWDTSLSATCTCAAWEQTHRTGRCAEGHIKNAQGKCVDAGDVGTEPAAPADHDS